MLNPDVSPIRKTRVLVAHPDALLCAGIAAVLATSPDFQVRVGESGSFGEVDVVIADLAAGLRAAGLGRKVLVLASSDREADVRTALRNGVRGFLLQSCGIEELMSAIRAIGGGGSALAPSAAARVAESFGYEELTTREAEVLHFVIAGFSDKDIARSMDIALGTVKSHMKQILTKLRAARRTEAAAIAQRRGIARADWAVAASGRN